MQMKGSRLGSEQQTQRKSRKPGSQRKLEKRGKKRRWGSKVLGKSKKVREAQNTRVAYVLRQTSGREGEGLAQRGFYGAATAFRRLVNLIGEKTEAININQSS